MTNAKLLSVGKGSFVLKNSGRTEKEVALALGGEERFSRPRRMRLNGRLYRAQKEDISTLRPVEPAPSIAADFFNTIDRKRTFALNTSVARWNGVVLRQAVCDLVVVPLVGDVDMQICSGLCRSVESTHCHGDPTPIRPIPE